MNRRIRNEQNSENNKQRWTCALCGRTMSVSHRVNHLLDHD